MGAIPEKYRPDEPWRDEQQLYRAYWEYYWSVYQIAEWVGVSNTTVRNEMDKYDIPRRSKQASSDVRWMRVQGRSLEEIREHVGAPRDEKSVEESKDDGGVEWTKLQS